SETDSELSQCDWRSKTVKDAFGGNPGFGARVFDGRVQYDVWSASVAQNPVSVRFAGTRPMTGVEPTDHTPVRARVP
uniref:hypothetical protein n=1 Tax=Clavibacter michiganensis TaxID=28447 RepID=UPI002930CAF2